MSGGHWNFDDLRVHTILRDIGEDGQVMLRFPKLAQIFRDNAEAMWDIIHILDWDLSGDSSIDDDREFEQKCVARLAGILQKRFKIRIYEITEDDEP